MTLSYEIAANEVIDETLINRSRFICYLSPCSSNEAAKVYLKHIQKLHPQAQHHCYAFVSDHPTNSLRYGSSDDGEPSGTAGRPMLNVLLGSNVGEVCAVVVRYFGGIKLGTGGLQRAYGGSVREAFVKLGTKTKIPMVHKTLECQYTQVNDLLHLLERIGGKVIDQQYQEHVALTLAIPIEQLHNVVDQLQRLSAGKLVLT